MGKIVSIKRKRKGTVSSQARIRKWESNYHFVPEIKLAGKWLEQLTGIGQTYHLHIDAELNSLTIQFPQPKEKEVPHDRPVS